MPIYADYSASAPLHKDVVQYLLKRVVSGPMGNPNSLHSVGRNLLKGIDYCKEEIGKILGTSPESIFLNSGASEGLSQIIQSYYFKNLKEKLNKNIFITSSIEHPAVEESLHFFKDLGMDVIQVPINKSGTIDLDLLSQIVNQHQEKILLGTFMAINNETGIVQPYQKIGQILKESNIPFLCDTTQLIGKLPFNFEQLPIDFAVCSGHKLGALGGGGLLLAKNPREIYPMIHGTLQEYPIRSGTQNYLGLETITIALNSIAAELSDESIKSKISAQRDFETKLKTKVPEIIIIGESAERAPLVSLISVPHIHSQALQIELESHNIFVTTSAACSDNEPQTSHVLKAMGISDEVGRGAIRISLGHQSYQEDYREILPVLVRSIQKLQKIQ